ncbi:regulator of G-protein signaling 9-binding protein [Amia ocellicauda]|uniref:regulator of G-protein signaling 9-binding protein n=1 Tax=Amia ocellicauda TaxID=2972642 RepID=UPI003463F369
MAKSLWHRTVGEITAARGSVGECQKAQAALTRVTACFQQLAVGVGSSTDCSHLREELEETRARAHHICTGLRRRLMAILTCSELGSEEREKAERLWVLFLSGIDFFLQELHKIAALQALFPLAQQRDHRALVSTGAVGRGVEVAARAATAQLPWAEGAGEEPPDLRVHIAQLEIMAQEMVQRVNVPIWSVEPMQEAWGEGSGGELELEDRVTSEELLTVEELPQGEHRTGCCHARGCRWGGALCLVT